MKTRIRELRLEKNLTQCALAEVLGITQTTLSRIENGSASPTVDTLARIAAGMGKQLRIEFV